MPSGRKYDHPVRDAIIASGDVHLFPELDIPLSTAKTWIRRGAREVIGFRDSETELLIRVKRLERQLALLVQIVRLTRRGDNFPETGGSGEGWGYTDSLVIFTFCSS